MAKINKISLKHKFMMKNYRIIYLYFKFVRFSFSFLKKVYIYYISFSLAIQLPPTFPEIVQWIACRHRLTYKIRPYAPIFNWIYQLKAYTMDTTLSVLQLEVCKWNSSSKRSPIGVFFSQSQTALLSIHLDEPKRSFWKLFICS